MRGWRGLLALLVLIPLATLAEASDSAAYRTGSSQTEVQDFGLVSEAEGWVLIDSGLYWTESGGQDWRDITPVDQLQSKILAAAFPKAREGWVLAQDMAGDRMGSYILVHTLDAGLSWDSIPFQLDSPGPSVSPEAAFYLHFIDAQTGWLAIKHVSGSNFSVGSLHKTTDGGRTWTRLSMPIGEPVYFVNGDTGWTAGGAAGNELFRTTDGGRTWRSQEVAAGTVRETPMRFYRLPAFRNDREGLLPVLAVGEQPRVELYATQDGGQSWELSATVPAPEGTVSPDGLPITVPPGAHAAVVLVDGDNLVAASDRGEIRRVRARDTLGGGITHLEMATPDVGWAMQTLGSCLRVGAPAHSGPSAPQPETGCGSETRLLRTGDGGRTWTALVLPRIQSSATHPGTPTPRAGQSGRGFGPAQESAARTERFVGQGFDKCEIATISQMQKWFTQSPYGAVNLYIGGASRACSNQALSASLLRELSLLGWRFIPTWVGPQAPCTTYSKRMSSDPAVAHAQGVSEANAAANVAAGLGLALPDGSGAIIYDDMEYYDTSNTACHEAVKSFISGWVGQLRARGSLAGVYATGSALGSFAALSNVPDAIWPAHWVADAYDPHATVWNVYALSNTLWSDHQRIRQYTGGHAETWGGASLNIDCNVIDGVVANVGPQGAGHRIHLPQIGVGGRAR